MSINSKKQKKTKPAPRPRTFDAANTTSDAPATPVDFSLEQKANEAEQLTEDTALEMVPPRRPSASIMDLSEILQQMERDTQELNLMTESMAVSHAAPLDMHNSQRPTEVSLQAWRADASKETPLEVKEEIKADIADFKALYEEHKQEQAKQQATEDAPEDNNQNVAKRPTLSDRPTLSHSYSRPGQSRFPTSPRPFTDEQRSPEHGAIREGLKKTPLRQSDYTEMLIGKDRVVLTGFDPEKELYIPGISQEAPSYIQPAQMDNLRAITAEEVRKEKSRHRTVVAAMSLACAAVGFGAGWVAHSSFSHQDVKVQKAQVMANQAPAQMEINATSTAATTAASSASAAVPKAPNWHISSITQSGAIVEIDGRPMLYQVGSILPDGQQILSIDAANAMYTTAQGTFALAAAAKPATPTQKQ